MIAILSCTYDDLYFFNLPLAVYSWNLLGYKTETFMPNPFTEFQDEKIIRKGLIVSHYIKRMAPNDGVITFNCPENKAATYTQCGRLYAATFEHIPEDEILITSDADMCVFNKEFWSGFSIYNGAVHIIGADLVPPSQVPMCYIAARKADWAAFMEIGNRTFQQCLDGLLGGIEAENFRGNYWAKDQETACNKLDNWEGTVIDHNRALPGTQFASRRADRDGWNVTPDIIDAHLPRPGYTEDNFKKIYDLFTFMYPDIDHRWMIKYREEYVKLL